MSVSSKLAVFQQKLSHHQQQQQHPPSKHYHQDNNVANHDFNPMDSLPVYNQEVEVLDSTQQYLYPQPPQQLYQSAKGSASNTSNADDEISDDDKTTIILTLQVELQHFIFIRHAHHIVL